MTDPVPFLRGCEGPLFQSAADEIERLRARLAERELDWLNQQEEIKDLRARLAEAEALLREASWRVEGDDDLSGRIDAFLAVECDHEFVGATCAKCGEALYDL